MTRKRLVPEGIIYRLADRNAALYLQLYRHGDHCERELPSDLALYGQLYKYIEAYILGEISVIRIELRFTVAHDIVFYLGSPFAAAYSADFILFFVEIFFEGIKAFLAVIYRFSYDLFPVLFEGLEIVEAVVFFKDILADIYSEPYSSVLKDRYIHGSGKIGEAHSIAADERNILGDRNGNILHTAELHAVHFLHAVHREEQVGSRYPSVLCLNDDVEIASGVVLAESIAQDFALGAREETFALIELKGFYIHQICAELTNYAAFARFVALYRECTLFVDKIYGLCGCGIKLRFQQHKIVDRSFVGEHGGQNGVKVYLTVRGYLCAACAHLSPVLFRSVKIYVFERPAVTERRDTYG